MNRDPSVQSNLDRIDRLKQNRTRRLKEEPSDATPGDTILIGDDVLVRENDKWTNITKPLRDRIAELETLVGIARGDIGLTRALVTYNDTDERRRQIEQQISLNENTVSAHSLSAPDTPLESQDERLLSPLERDVLRFVYGDDNNVVDPDTDELCVQVAQLSPYNSTDDFVGQYNSRDNRIVMDTDYFSRTENMGSDTTLTDIDPTDRQVLNYLTTFVHETVHFWQDQIGYEPRYAYYFFGEAELSSIRFKYQEERTFFFSPDRVSGYDFGTTEDNVLFSEQLASMVQIWFAISWQLEYLPIPTDGSERMIDLSGEGDLSGEAIFDGIHGMSRYSRIADIPYADTQVPFDDGNVMIDVPKRLVSEGLARDILDDFDKIMDVVQNSNLITRDNSKSSSLSPSQQN